MGKYVMSPTWIWLGTVELAHRWLGAMPPMRVEGTPDAPAADVVAFGLYFSSQRTLFVVPPERPHDGFGLLPGRGGPRAPSLITVQSHLRHRAHRHLVAVPVTKRVAAPGVPQLATEWGTM